MTAAAPRRPLAVRLYRLLLAWLLPPRFRREFADEMALVFADLHDAATRAGGDRCGLLALGAELPGLLRLAVRARRAERAERAHRTTTAPRDRDMVDSLLQDLRFALRSLRRSPGFTLVAVLTLALGVGANTAIFSVVDGVLLAPLPLREPDRLVAVGERVDGGAPTDFTSTSPGSFFDWQRQTRTVRLAGFAGSARTLTGRGEPERLLGASTVGGLFDVLGVPPLFGRTITPADETPEAQRVIVLSYATWRRLFGEDRGVVGRTLTLDGASHTIVGVMPPSFRFPDTGTEFWVPSRFDAEFRANRDQYFIQVVGRLAPGATLEQARTELAVVSERLQRDWPMYNSDLRIVVRPLQETIVEGVRTRLLVLMAAVAFVLLITCANLGNLLLARASGRHREIAVRQALGAGRTRLARQLLTESLVLALAGGAAGLLVGQGFLELLLAAQATTNLPRVDEIGLDARVLLFTLGVSVAAGLFFGSLPAWQLARARSGEALRTGTRGSAGHQWARSALVVSELALAMVLLTGAGLLLRSFALMQRVDPGFTADHVLTFDVTRPGEDASFTATSLERIRALPGVRSAAVVSQLPVTGRGIGAWFNRLDRPLPPDVKPTGEAYRVVTPGYFATIGLPLKRGRLLTPDDRRERPAVVINEALARRYYAGEDPIGKAIYLGAPDNRLFDHGTIVGVVGDTRDAGLGSDPLPTVYIPLAVMPGWRSFSYVVRTAGPPTAVAGAVRNVIRTLDATVPVRNVRTLDAVLAESVAPARWSTTLLGVFAGVALVMAALGVFGVLSFVVAQRTRELGIRMALGAAPSAVRRTVVRQGLRLVVAGLALGLAGAFALTRLMGSLLYGVAPTDPATYAGVAAVLVGTAAVASWLPARRATRVDPIIALRAE
ncbi:MAG TPA: ABC transporter permease [Gemmatimonadaceae bacterium]|nr:ABC transporter permease [Gemmatimonadaceae bacterium]